MELPLEDLNEKSEQLRYMVEHGTVITERAQQGKTKIENQFKEFTKKNIEKLMEQTKSLQVNKILFLFDDQVIIPVFYEFRLKSPKFRKPEMNKSEGLTHVVPTILTDS